VRFGRGAKVAVPEVCSRFMPTEKGSELAIISAVVSE
jgi:hypothetical protein